MKSKLPSTSSELGELRAALGHIRFTTWELLSADEKLHACKRDKSYSYLTEIYTTLSEALDDVDIEAARRVEQNPGSSECDP